MQPDDEEPANGTCLTSAEISEFFEAGLVIRRGLFDSDEITKIADCFDRLRALADGLPATCDLRGSHFVIGQKDGRQVLKRVVWAGGSQPYLLEIGEDPRLTVPCGQLLDSNTLEQLLSQAHFKEPGDGVIFGWHQDIQHRDKGDGNWRDVNGRGSFVQTLIVIDEMTPDSGPLQFIPGSGKWGRVDFGDHDYDDPGYQPKTPPQFHDEDVVTITAKPGDTLFFGPYTAHASFENKTNRNRRVFINGYAYPGANSRDYPGDGSCRQIHIR